MIINVVIKIFILIYGLIYKIYLINQKFILLMFMEIMTEDVLILIKWSNYQNKVNIHYINIKMKIKMKIKMTIKINLDIQII